MFQSQGFPQSVFLVQSMMEVDPTGALLEAHMYTVVEVLETAAVRTHASNQRYQYCYCGPNMGQMGHEDLMVALGPDTSNAVVVMVDTRLWRSSKMMVLCFKVIITCKVTFPSTKIACWTFVLLIWSTVVRLFALCIFNIQIHRYIPIVMVFAP